MSGAIVLAGVLCSTGLLSQHSCPSSCHHCYIPASVLLSLFFLHLPPTSWGCVPCSTGCSAFLSRASTDPPFACLSLQLLSVRTWAGTRKPLRCFEEKGERERV